MTMAECPHSGPKYVSTAGLCCYDCVPAADKLRYPEWEKREAQQARRAEIARKNFGHTEMFQAEK
jgi:hypothetical protein